MRNFLKMVLADMVAVFLLCSLLFMAGVFFVITGLLGKEIPQARQNSVLVLDFRNPIVESPADDQAEVFNFSNKTKSILLYDAIKAVKNAETDSNIKGISIETDNISAGITQLDDLRDALQKFKKSGKFVYAYGNTVSQPSYYLGSVADKYFLNPAGGIELKGLSTEVMYFKDFLDKYGIGVEVIRHGKFKAAVEPFLRNDLSPENKEQLATMLGDIWQNISTKISDSRKISFGNLQTAADSLYGAVPESCIKYKLADNLLQKSQYDEFLKAEAGLQKDDELRTVLFSKYISSMKENTDGGSIAVLYASGEISGGKGAEGIHSDDFIKTIKDLEEDNDVKAVVFRINSPGGSANASDAILYELQQLRLKKPLAVSFGDYAASGGYYIAMAADKIFTEPNTVTGSIGVFGIIPNVKGLANKNGISAQTVATNANSDMVSFVNGVSPFGVKTLTRGVENTYKRFVYFVTKNRKKTIEQIDAIGGGHVWSGTRAVQLGLADATGSLQDAIDYAATKAGLKSYTLTVLPERRNKFEEYFGGGEDLELKMVKSRIGGDNYRLLEKFLLKPKPSVEMFAPLRISF